MSARVAVLKEPEVAQQVFIIDALQAHLQTVRDLIAGLSVHSFRARPSAASGSVGEHVRHCLDHVRALTAAKGLTEMSYDSRLRGTPVETDPAAAIDEVDRLCLELDEWTDASLARPLVLRTLTHKGAPPVSVRTTLAREAAFVIQHTIHHCATLAVLLERMNLPVPRGLGYAPSTPDSSRARSLARG